MGWTRGHRVECQSQLSHDFAPVHTIHLALVTEAIDPAGSVTDNGLLLMESNPSMS